MPDQAGDGALVAGVLALNSGNLLEVCSVKRRGQREGRLGVVGLASVGDKEPSALQLCKEAGVVKAVQVQERVLPAIAVEDDVVDVGKPFGGRSRGAGNVRRPRQGERPAQRQLIGQDLKDRDDHKANPKDGHR